MPESSPRVLIIRLDAIGDAVALTPLLAAFAAEDIPVDILLQDVNRDVLSDAAGQERFVAPFALRCSTAKNLRAIDRYGEELRERGYTHVLVATEDAAGYRLAKATGATHRIGFTNGFGKPLKSLWAQSFLTRTIHRSAGLDRRGVHECAVLFELGRSLLGSTTPTRDVAQLRPLILDGPVVSDLRALIQITDKWERLGMRFEDVCALIDGLRSRFPLRAVASHAERAYAKHIDRATGLESEIFSNVIDWKNAIAASRVVVAPDSGAIHVAGMVGTPVVAVYQHGPEFPLQSRRWAPWAARSRTVEAIDSWWENAVASAEELA